VHYEQIVLAPYTIAPQIPTLEKQNKMKNALRERQTLRALAVVRRSQKNSPRRRPLPVGAGRPKFNQLETGTTFTYKPSLVKIDARNFELSW